MITNDGVDINNIIAYIKDNTTFFVALVTFAIAMLGQLLSFVEFLRLKARWDYYNLNEIGRQSKRTGFNLEYLLTSLLIVFIIAFAIFSGLIKFMLKDLPTSIFVFVAIVVIIFIVAFLIYYVFALFYQQSGLFNKKEYGRFILIKSGLTTIKYAGIILACFFILYDNTVWITALLMVFAGAYYVFFDYCMAKYLVKCLARCQDIMYIDYKPYCIIFAAENHYYLKKVEITPDNELVIMLDTQMVVETDDKFVRQMIFKNTIMYFDGHKI